MKIKNIDRKKKYDRLLVALNTSNDPYSFIFHLGYQGFLLPRCLRRMIAKTRAHRAWLSGFTGLGVLSILELSSTEEHEIRPNNMG